MTYVRRFVAFWYDFLVGDRPELFAGSIAILAVVWLAIGAGLRPAAAGFALVLLVAALGGLSVWVASRPKR